MRESDRVAYAGMLEENKLLWKLLDEIKEQVFDKWANFETTPEQREDLWLEYRQVKNLERRLKNEIAIGKDTQRRVRPVNA